jgi:hypothetical protein
MRGRAARLRRLNNANVKVGRAVTPSPASTRATAEMICSTSNRGLMGISAYTKAASIRRRTDEAALMAMN